MSSNLYSEAYRDSQQEMHETYHEYGSASVGYAKMVSDIANQISAKHILDYGSGKGRLAQHLALDHQASVHLYEPAIKEISSPPEPQELVACIDVLEHIEPEYLDNVLDDLKRVTIHYGFFTVHTGPAVKHLPDGRNAHLTQEPIEWWMPKLMERFSVQSMSVTNNGFWVVVTNKGNKNGD